jgi:hypothetical protein
VQRPEFQQFFGAWLVLRKRESLNMSMAHIIHTSLLWAMNLRLKSNDEP